MSKLLSINAAAKALGVSTSTLRRWETAGRLVPVQERQNQTLIDRVRRATHEAQC